MSTSDYRLIALPKLNNDDVTTPSGTQLAEKYREFRLLALKSSPSAFASSYEEESKRGLEQTHERLTNTKATQLVALEQDQSREPAAIGDEIGELIDHTWQGFIVLLGPQEGSAGEVSAAVNPFNLMTQLSSDRDTTHESSGSDQTQSGLHFHLNGLFVRPTARGRGLGRILTEAAVAKAISTCRELCAKEVLVTIIVDEGNPTARSLYDGCGFVVVARETYRQQDQHGGDDCVALRMELRRTLDQ